MKIALATCERFSDLPPDELLFERALAVRGIDVRPAVWTDPAVKWESFDAVVVRSTWDYHLNAAGFARWVRRVSKQTTLINQPDSILWNVHKQYLIELQTKGIEIVPTILLRRGEQRPLDSLLKLFGVSEVVIKPAVSASGYRTVVVGSGHLTPAHGERMLRDSIADHDTLVQPFLREIFDPGERSLMFFDGVFSHAVLRPALSEGAEGGESRGNLLQPPPGQIEFARRVLGMLDRRPVYARVDVIPMAPGTLALAELELVEPSLYFEQCPAAAQIFADAVIAYAA
ncbi:MAG: hypothetical protein NVS9B12_06680 [Vulcanimicrobiaceae bacterium]